MTGTLESISNKETWTGTLEFVNDTNGSAWFAEESPPDEITMKLRDPNTKGTVLSLSLTGGDLEVVDDGQVEFTAASTVMAAIDPKTYEVGILYTDGGVITQVLLGTISVLDGL